MVGSLPIIEIDFKTLVQQEVEQEVNVQPRTNIAKAYKSVLLINPPYSMETGKDRKETYEYAIIPPIGMLTIAGELEKNDYKVSFIDAELEFLSDKQLIDKILELKPDVVGIYCITANFKRIVELSKELK